MKQIITLKESELKAIITESVKKALLNRNITKRNKGLLKESQESKSISQAKQLVMKRLGYDEQEADDFIRVKLRGDMPNLRTRNGGKFILGVTRMFLDRQLTTATDINKLNQTLKLVSSDAHVNEYDRNLNNLSAKELIDRFSTAMTDNLMKDKDEVNNLGSLKNNGYDIVKIESFKQASQYSRYTSWCVTHYENMYNSYTDDGLNTFYFCLKKGFEKVPKVMGEGCPLDEYGLSMIAVSVDESGMLNTCTCRWNHDNGGNDNIMDTKQISSVIGANFYDTFKGSVTERPDNTNLNSNSYEYVDLGLPSGTLWATCNVGASSPKEYGLYFAWGETRGYSDASERKFTRDEYDFDKGFEDGVTANMGGDWHTPTNRQLKELQKSCTYSFTDGGMLITSRINGATLFIPAAGYCWNGSVDVVGGSGFVWSSSVSEDYPDDAWYLHFNSTYMGVSYDYRGLGQSLRGVLG